ncbi:MAG TPA: T9SS type A sorting domain-containing protein [Flavisolibacter sp.]|nr:T9SS type A sorting domain-containing protein [Flavisolibacter sp.]
MKTRLLFVISLFVFNLASAQITTPIIKAGFGVDADLRANYFNNFLQAGNDDWFNNGTQGPGQSIIDTTGAAAMVARIQSDATFRKQPFFRTMRVPQYSIVNNRVWIDAVYIRDYNGQSGGDETAFVSSNKNGDSPAQWTGGATSVLDKNDIAEMMVHVRREGPKGTDPLWFFGGLSLQGTTGNRYFDFELYQTDIFYTRSNSQFSNYGPDAGHTSWQFDAAGNILKTGDVIFSAEFSSSSLTLIEARVWVHRSALNITPKTFDWSGKFDGASNGSAYGYASIKPKLAGTYYTGLQSGNNTWAGPFGFVDGGNIFRTTYSARQFLEFSVNLTHLGLDPLTLLGGSACGLPFRRILVKTRTSTSFTSELKDFIGPFDFFNAPRVNAQAEAPFLCANQPTTTINVLNPLAASVYTWSTPDGRIISEATGPSIRVDTVGTYIVSQQLLDGCSTYGKDTVVVGRNISACVTLASQYQLKGKVRSRNTQLTWQGATNQGQTALVQRSTDGVSFYTISTTISQNSNGSFAATDDINAVKAPFIFYRLQIQSASGKVEYSNAIRLQNDWQSEDVLLFPNPAVNKVQLLLPSLKGQEAFIKVFDRAGALVYMDKAPLSGSSQVYTFKNTEHWQKGLYLVNVQINENNFTHKLMLTEKIH